MDIQRSNTDGLEGRRVPQDHDGSESGTSNTTRVGQPRGMAAHVNHPCAGIWSAFRPYWDSWKRIWNKRWQFSYVLYVVVFLVVTALAVGFLQWSMYKTPDFDASVDRATRESQSALAQATTFVSNVWIHRDYRFLLNCIVLGVAYLFLIFLINRFWIATAVFVAVMVVYAVANMFKVRLRNEPVLPSDLSFIKGGNTSNILSFIPPDQMPLVRSAVSGLVSCVVVLLLLQVLDRRRGLITTHWRHPMVSIKVIVGNASRLLAVVLSFTLVFSFTWNLSIPESRAQHFAADFGDVPQIWDGWSDAAGNGPTMNFLRLTHVDAMDKPKSYSEGAMRQMAKRYKAEAADINQSRSANLTDNTVIMILSESYSDPTRVPGISLGEDPMPNIRGIKAGTTSGLMLSPGYGGGTANIEYQALTGLSMANFNPSLSVAYQQLIPGQQWTPAFNQVWNAKLGKKSSQAVHTYSGSMYFRNINYKKFGFDKFWTTDSKTTPITNCSPIDSAWYASDKCTYQNVLDHLNTDSGSNQFLQVVTMQNHLPYNDWYQNNQFKNEDASVGLGDEERTSVETYAKGVSYTDQATLDFLNTLDGVNRPITVIFYGDHLPGIYDTANSDKNNILGLHETDYFIWSNQASAAHGTKLPDVDSQYTSSNYFMAQTAEHLNAKVSPYLAFLTELHAAVPAMSIPASAGTDENTVYLDALGQRVTSQQLSASARTLLKDYKLIQYDISKGKNYLKGTGFMQMP